MKKNKLKELFKAGKPIINSWLAIPSSFSAEVMSNQGWDSLTIDMQHGLIDYPNAVSMLQAISTTETTPMARVNWNEPGQIMKILDAGCYGIICPMVSNRKEAEKFIQACNVVGVSHGDFSLVLEIFKDVLTIVQVILLSSQFQ